ncbi:hypothetical protein PsYK624_075740 [Phanerochaete sordida]|uniref:Uncharacterized protein n=1 Tax=Phanerochaete sordida TaxID=48140 RepID=A0A9P3GBP7_9APHY|nr:hypothetical protein PsYK624_075740 [Phanerochaete sordida]
MNSPPQLAALASLASFFVVVGWLTLKILRSIPGSRQKEGAEIFLVLSGLSFVVTWFYMSKFIAWSFMDYEATVALVGTTSEKEFFHTRVADWLLNTSLFEQAWKNICFGSAWSWWWNQQLCLYTAGAWTVFLTVEGNRYNIKHLWAYMLLGQMLTISVGANLFFYAVARAQRAGTAPPPARVPLLLAATVPLSMAIVFCTPWTGDATFGPALTLMHVLLFAPLVVRPAAAADKHEAAADAGVNAHAFFRLAMYMTLAMHAHATYTAYTSTAPDQRALAGLARAALDALYSHPAQTSVGWDGICVTLSCAVWAVYSGGYVGRALKRGARFVVGTLVGSVSFAVLDGELE